MDQATIQKIAAEVAKLVPNYTWALILIQAVLTMVAAAVGAFVSEYLKTRGKHLATKADFDEVLSQVRANTEVVETIKAEVSQKEWAKREWTNIRRVKLEELLKQMNECRAHSQRRRSTALDGEVFEEPDPAPMLESLGRLYFPELQAELSTFSLAYGPGSSHLEACRAST